MMKTPWGSIQVGINAASVITCACTVMPLAYIRKYFTGLCILYADIRISAVNLTARSLTVDMVHSVWGSNENCDYTTFLTVVAGIHAFVWCWFFLLMKGQLKSEHKEFPLLIMSFILHAMVLAGIFVSSCMISVGTNSWCFDLVNEVNRFTRIGREISCADTQTFNWTNVYQTQSHHVHDFLLTAKISSWIATLTLIAQTLVCGYKIYEWILNTSGEKENKNNCSKDSEKGLKKRKKKTKAKKEKEKQSGARKSRHFPEFHLHMSDVQGHLCPGQRQYELLEDDEGDYDDDNDNRGYDETDS